ncbi:acyl-CoA thioesterase [Lederbergia sp. NSJ-179]|uniref:acyl-CoA thioesterase n=1 Tax=Lederbergia sp. NSJ-179 TaxID=2931402 RepID=UPI001FD29B5C|nr:thioesterase family protein [Lederbergia sp. NSJ-179]MCJ7841251.1 acyl-CoA thioesterase [Lederbergia sp. NSJ-179]
MFMSETNIEVRYAETDQMGIVYHANYLIWMEIGRTKLMEDLGFHYTKMEEDGILAPVIDIQVSYHHPVKYGDDITIKTWIEDYNGLRTTYGYKIFSNHDNLVVTGFSKHVCVKKDTFKPLSLRKLYPDWHQAYLKAKKDPHIEGLK